MRGGQTKLFHTGGFFGVRFYSFNENVLFFYCFFSLFTSESVRQGRFRSGLRRFRRFNFV